MRYDSYTYYPETGHTAYQDLLGPHVPDGIRTLLVIDGVALGVIETGMLQGWYATDGWGRGDARELAGYCIRLTTAGRRYLEGEQLSDLARAYPYRVGAPVSFDDGRERALDTLAARLQPGPARPPIYEVRPRARRAPRIPVVAIILSALLLAALILGFVGQVPL